MVAADYDYVKVPKFAVLDMNLWLKEESICISFAPSDECI